MKQLSMTLLKQDLLLPLSKQMSNCSQFSLLLSSIFFLKLCTWLRETRSLLVVLRAITPDLRKAVWSTVSWIDFMGLSDQQFQQPASMRNQFLKRTSLAPTTPLPLEISPFFMRDLEKTIDPHSHLPGKHKCHCQLCIPGRFPDGTKPDDNVFHTNSKESSRWFKKILDGLTLSGAKTLRLYLPDILFVEGESLQVFQTNRKDGRVVKLAGLIPLKLIYPTFLRLRREYKNLLEQSYNQQMLEKINPEYMHLKYFQKIVPSHFDAGNDSATLERNKNHFRKYVLQSDKKYQIQQIEQHKMNEKQPFCLIKYSDGNCQLFNQAQFQLYALTPISKIAQESTYFQSYIKYKQEADSILFSTYTYTSTEINEDIDKRAEREVMVLLGAINRYDDDYKDIETLEELTVDLMQTKHKEYADLMTYKIVHYLAMASRIYVTHIKLKWILNDISNIYLQEIMEIEFTDLPPRIIRFRLPLKDDSLQFYNGNNFVDIYKDMKKRKAINTLIIKKDIDTKTYDEILNIMDPDGKHEETTDTKPPISHRERLPSFTKRNKAGSETSRTIQVSKSKPISPTNFNTIQAKPARYHNFSTYEEHLKQHPEIVMKTRPYNSTSLGRYSEAPSKMVKVDKKINNHFIFNMSSEDYKTFNSPDEKPSSKTAKEQIEEYMEKRNQKVSQSVLYNTFHQLNCQRMKQVNETFKKQQMSKIKSTAFPN